MTTTDAWVPASTFGARLALVRHHMGWNLKEAARECGLPAASWRNWEAGRRPHDLLGTVHAISERTGVNGLWLLYGESGPGTYSAQGTQNSVGLMEPSREALLVGAGA